MATIYVDGKAIEVCDEGSIKRPPPSTEYEPIQADFFDIEKMVQESKNAWIENQVIELMNKGVDEETARKGISDLPHGVEEKLREGIVLLVNETIETELEKFELYRNYTKTECQKLIDKYDDLLSNAIIDCREIEHRMKKYSHLIGEEDESVLESHTEDLQELDALYSEWINQDLKKQKYELFVKDFKEMQLIAR